MQTLDRPLRFEPYLRPMVWGGRRLGTLLGKELKTDGLYGESWEISDHPSHYTKVATGPWAPATLHELMATQREALLGSAAVTHATFPWLVKFLDACDWLSVQVHPNEADVRRLLPGEGSKTEAWFILDAEPGSRVYAGLPPGIDEARLRRALSEGSVTSCLHQFEPRPGDCVFLPAGTVHAVGGGVLMAEVQQTSDATFRLYDWDRRDQEGNSRPLHVEQALASINWEMGPVQPTRVPGFGTSAARIHQELVRCRYFELEYLRTEGAITLPGESTLRVVIVLEGQGAWNSSGAQEGFRLGETWLIPAALGAIECRPESRVGMLISTLPG
jgi:mannose-6-phosphate isomerase